jgi:NitT/TauT family transport system substrate-binding protein
VRTSVKVMALAAVASLAAACGNSASGSSDSAGASGSSGKSLTDVTVGIVPFTPNAVLFLAQKNGLFKKHGLNVTTESAAAPTPIVASMVAGKEQFGFLTTPVLINANSQGTSVKCVSPIDGQTAPDRDASALVAKKDSGITSPKDLSGKTVAVVQLSSINLIGAQKIITDAGGKDTKFVAMPFPQMPQALADGRVDAAVITSPYLQTALQAGAVALAHPSSDLWPNGTIYCYAATASYLQKNAKVAKEFQDAMVEAINYTKTHEDEAKATLVDQLKLSPEQAQAQVIPSNFVPKIDVKSIASIQDVMVEQGAVKKTVKPADLVWTP